MTGNSGPLETQLAAANERTNVHVTECVRLVVELAEADERADEWKRKWMAEGHEAAAQDARARSAEAERDQLRAIVERLARLWTDGADASDYNAIGAAASDCLVEATPGAVNESEVDDE